MAASLSNEQPIVSINITPFVDVVLVLLIIFMATSSYIANPAIEVELPQAASGAEVVETSIALVLDAEGSLFLNGERSDAALVGAYCRAESLKHPKVQAIISAAGQARHEQVVQLIDLVRLNGVTGFAINIEHTAAQ